MDTSQKSDEYQKYYSAVQYLESLGNIAGGYQRTNLKAHPRPGIFLERMQDFLDTIGNPESRFKYIHVTGTAGKGTVATLIQATLVAAGKKAGVFTSPFTVSTVEKIQVGDRYIDHKSFARIVDFLKPHIDQSIESSRHGMPSYFEIIFAIALLYFKQEHCEYAILEVGLGGRYDATNVIKKPVVTCITNIDLDHTNVLGTRREDIALDKAGIIKRKSLFFTTEHRPKLLRIFEKVCLQVGATFHPLDVRGLDYAARNRLLAAHACVAIGAISHTQDAIARVRIPARFEVLLRLA